MTPAEKLTEQFYEWEIWGRGWLTLNAPVRPEPPFTPFYGHYVEKASLDDGREATVLSSWMTNISRTLTGESSAPKPSPEESEAKIRTLLRDPSTEFVISLPPHHPDDRDTFAQVLANLTHCQEPLALELIGTEEAITPLLAVHPEDVGVIRQQFAAYFPKAVLSERQGVLQKAWKGLSEPAIAEFGLSEEFMLPLKVGKTDLFIGLTSVLSELEPDETALFQVLFEPVRHPWAESILRAMSDGKGGCFFVDYPESLAAAKQKISRPLYAAVVRLAAKCPDHSRAWEIVRRMAGVLDGITHPNGNELIPLDNEYYPPDDHEEDVLLRQTRRPGMLLNTDELLGFVHLPSSEVKTSKLVREKGDSKAAPLLVRSRGILLGHNLHAGEKVEVRLSPDQRVRHTHLIGASGTGKSTLLFNLIRQDIANGEGLAVLDPHGDLIEQILGVIPSNRIGDVVLLDPSDEEYPVGFNILSAHSELEKTLLASDLSSVFKRLSTSWGDQMHSVLSNAILAFLESSQGGTLSDLRRFLLDAEYRNKFLQTVSDPEVVYYWRKAFPQLGGNKSLGPLMTRLETFLGPKPIRYMVSQKENRLDFGDIMDSSKIFLAKLPQGQIGKENAYLLGSLLMSKFQQQAMSRQSMNKAARRNFWLYVDEFSHFITPSMAEILTSVRKYNLGLILAHQELRQLQQDADVAGAVMSNAGTRIVFRVGDADARTLAEGFESFEADSLRKLGVGEAICRVERSDFDFNLTVPLPEVPPDSEQTATLRGQVIASSRAQYATPRAEVQAMLTRQFEALVEAEIKPVPQASKPRPPQGAVVSPPPVVSVPPPEPEIVEVKEESRIVPKASKTDAAATSKEPPPLPTVEGLKAPIEPIVPKSLGKGGQKHKYLQQLIKQWAQGMGYMAVIEQPIDGGQIDVALQKNKRKIACEISITTAAGHEIGNIKKCLAAGYEFIVLIIPDEKRLSSFQKIISPSLTGKDAEKVRLCTPDGLFEFIESLDAQDATKNETIKGYKVKVKHQAVDRISKAEKLKMLAKIVADSIKKIKE